jgi:hypothetical protein
MKNFIENNKWYILGFVGLAGLGVATALLFERFFNLKNPNPKKILFVGDSISTGESTYPAIIRRERSDLQIDTLSQGGKRTDWMLENLKSQLASNKYDRVYIYGGVNDAFSTTPISSILSNVQSMVNLINENGADAFIISGYVVDGFMDLSKFTPSKYVTEVSGFIPLIDRYKQYQSSLFKTIKNAKIIKPINLGNRTGDGIHPNGEGQRIIANEVLKTI